MEHGLAVHFCTNPNRDLADLQNSRPAPLIACHNGDFHATHHCDTDRQTDVSFQDRFPGMFASTSELICLYFLVFLFFHFLVAGSFSAFSALMLLVGRQEGHHCNRQTDRQSHISDFGQHDHKMACLAKC